MSDSEKRGRKRSWWRAGLRVFLKSILFLVCLYLSIIGFVVNLGLAESTYPSDYALPGFLAGILFAGIGGYLVSRVILACVRLGGPALVMLFVDAAAMVFLFAAFLSYYTGPPALGDVEDLEPLILACTVLLLTANSFVIGHVLFPGRERYPNRRRLVAVACLYGSVLAGYFVLQVFPPPWQKVPPYASFHEERADFQSVLEEARVVFPPEVTIQENEGGLRLRAEFENRPYHHLIKYTGDVIQVDGDTVELDEGTVRFLGFGMYRSGHLVDCVGGEPRWNEDSPVKISPRGSDLAVFWRPDGTPVPRDAWPEVRRAPPDRLFWTAFVIETEDDLRLSERIHPELVLLPWENRFIQFSGMRGVRDDERNLSRYVMLFYFGPPIPGPLELRAHFIRAPQREYTLPNLPGETLRLERNSIRVLKAFPGRYQRAPYRMRETPLPSGVYEHDFERRSGEGTMVFFVTPLPEEFEFRLGIEGIGKDGTIHRPELFEVSTVFIAVQFDCAAGDIDRFRIVERPAVTEVRFRVPDIPIFPSENSGLENMLDLRIPYPIFRERDVDDLFLHGMENRWRVRTLSLPDPLSVPISAGSTLHEALNSLYGDSWRVDRGAVRKGDEFRPRVGGNPKE